MFVKQSKISGQVLFYFIGAILLLCPQKSPLTNWRSELHTIVVDFFQINNVSTAKSPVTQCNHPHYLFRSNPLPYHLCDFGLRDYARL